MNTLTQDSRKLGARIRARREHLHRTQLEIATALSISRGNYSKYESGEVNISAMDLARLAKILNVTVAYLYDEEEDAPAQEVEYQPILDELHSASYSGGFETDDVEEIAEYIRMKAQRRAKKRGSA